MMCEADASCWADLPRELLEPIVAALDPFEACGAAAACRCAIDNHRNDPRNNAPGPPLPPGLASLTLSTSPRVLAACKPCPVARLFAARSWRAAVLARDVPRLELTVSPLERRRAGQLAWLRCVVAVTDLQLDRGDSCGCMNFVRCEHRTGKRCS